MTLRRVAWLCAGSLAALSLFGMAALLVEHSYRPAYDQSDPDYEKYRAEFERLRVQFVRRGPANDDFLDLSRLNQGDWTTACLFGGYASALQEIDSLGADISDPDRQRLTEARRRGLRLAEVEEHEMMIAYVDRRNKAHFVHFETGLGSEGKRLTRCITKPETRLHLVPR